MSSSFDFGKFFNSKTTRPQFLVKLQNTAHAASKVPIGRPVARAIEILIRLIWSAHLAPAAKIAPSVHFAHNGLGVIIHPLCEIGENCVIGPHVVLGGKAPQIGAPSLGQGVIVHAGAKIVGPVHIGDKCIIGANAVLLKDLASNCVAVGVPARVVKTDIDASKFR